MPALLEDPFYNDPADPHRYAMYEQFTTVENQPFLRDHDTQHIESRDGTVLRSRLEGDRFVQSIRLTSC